MPPKKDIKKTREEEYLRILLREQEEKSAHIPGEFANGMKKFKEKLAFLLEQYTLFNQQNYNWSYENKHELSIFEQWLPYYMELHDIDLLAGTAQSKKLKWLPSQLYLAPEKEIFFKSFDFFSNSNWPARFSSKFAKKFRDLPIDTKKAIIAYIIHYLEGYVGVESQIIHSETWPYMSFFKTKFGQRWLIWMVGVERVPELDKTGVKVKKYDYIHYMRFIEIIKDVDYQTAENVCKQVMHEFRKDPARSEFSHELEEKSLSNFRLFTKRQQNFCIDVEIADIKNGENKKAYNFYPTSFKPNYLTENESSALIYSKSINRWTTKQKVNEIEHAKYNQYAAKVNAELLEKFADFQSAAKLVELLEAIPNFKIRLTSEERSAIGQSGNVLTIGRSGTGKTTCAVLRLFASEILFKIRATQAKLRNQMLLRDTKFNSDDVDNTIGLHCVFVTASPVLTNEVCRYYHRLTDQIKDELKKKEQRIRERKRLEQLKNQKDEKIKEKEVKEAQKQEKETKKSDDQPIIQEKKEEEIMITEIKKPDIDNNNNNKNNKDDEIALVEEEMKGIELKEEIKETDEDDEKDYILDEDDGSNEYLAKMNNYSSFDNIHEKDFPLFLTVRKLVIMIDGTLDRPFFSRNAENQVIGSDKNAQWHNEQTGVLLIDNYHKKVGFVDNKDDNLDENLVDSDLEDEYDLEDFDDQKEIEEEYERQLALQAKREKRKKGLNSFIKQKKFSFEVDYDYFVNKFWPIINKRFPSIPVPPIVIWGEIQSVIKGSPSSHMFAASCLPESTYLGFESSRKEFLDQKAKKFIYDMFREYEQWKSSQQAYDFMDVVNYILIQTRWKGYKGQAIHYLMIDEVQDLSHATILLLAKITEQNLFFSGDSAQTIAKGVGLKFCELSSIFNSSLNYENKKICQQPIVKQLTINFRSHGKILDLANSIVSLIEVFFPKTIDRLKKEKSLLDGPKPILLEDDNIELLFLVLFGTENYKSQRHSTLNKGSLLNKVPIEFGCNQVILVRDQESKNKLPDLLKHALCLTIYEAKGLEFDDVILYNFFSDSSADFSTWSLLSYAGIEDKVLTKEEYERVFCTYEEEKKITINELDGDDDNNQEKDASEAKSNIEKIEEKNKNLEWKIRQAKDMTNSVNFFNLSADEKQEYHIKKVYKRGNFKNADISQNSLLCNELKQLYVAITRPRNRLIIFDENSQKRKQLQKFWMQLFLVQQVSTQILDLIDGNIDSATNKELASFKSLLSKTSEKEWRKQGIKMFKNKYYEQALKCFEKSGDEKMRLRSMAYLTAEKATKMKNDAESRLNLLNDKNVRMTTNEKKSRKALIATLNENKKKAKGLFKEAAKIFESIGLIKQAAQCYFSSRKLKKACEIYENLQLWKQAGEAAYELGDFTKAGLLFDKGNDYIRAIDAYDKLENYLQILEIIKKYDEICHIDKELLIRKYAKLALESLLDEVDYKIEDKIQKEDEQTEQEKKFKLDLVMEKPEDEESDLEIEDDDDDDSSSENEEDIKIDNVPELKNEEKKEKIEMIVVEKMQNECSTKPEDNKIIEIDRLSLDKEETSNNKLDNMSFDIISIDKSSIIESSKKSDNKPNNQQESKAIDDMSFDEISLEGSQAKNISDMSFEEIKSKDNNNLKTFDHLSNYDPEDEWLKMEKGSIIESINNLRKQNSNIYSDFSAVDYNHIMNNKCVLVKTKADIFVQDSVMQKIIKIISYISDDAKQSLLNIRSKDTLLSTSKKNDSEYDEITDYIIDLDLININFVYIILDILENYKLYKLCIFVCNRYKLSSRIGRYLVNIAHRYSNFPIENMTYDKQQFHNRIYRQMQQEKGFVANTALHTVLENINPDFLTLKKKGEIIDHSNSLGYECFTELINLGFWKKCLFIMDYENSLALASTFASFQNYRIIFLDGNTEYKLDKIKYDRAIQNSDFEFLPFETPSNEFEVNLCLNTLDSVIWELTERNPKFLNKPYVEIGKNDQNFKIPTFASYFAYNGIFWNHIFNKNEIESEKLFMTYLKESIPNLLKIFMNSNFQSEIIDLRIYDLVTFYILILQYLQYIPSLSNCLLKLDCKLYTEFCLVLSYCIKFLTKLFRINKYTEVIFKGMLTPFRLRLIEKCKVLEHLRMGYIMVHISSPIINEFDYVDATNQENLIKKSTYIIDLEGNFIIAPIKVCFDILKNKLIDSFRYLVNIRVRSKIQDRFCINLLNNEVYRPFENAEYYDEKIEDLLGCIYLIDLYATLHDQKKIPDQKSSKKSTKNELVEFKKTDPLYNYEKSRIKERLSQLYTQKHEFDDTIHEKERFIMERKIEKEIKYLKKIMIEAKYEDKPFNDQRIQFMKILKIVNKFMFGTKLQLPSLLKHKLIEIFLEKSIKHCSHQKYSFSTFCLGHLNAPEVYFSEFIRRYPKNFSLKDLSLLHDGLGYQKFDCVEEFANHVFEYLANSFNRITLEEKIILMETCVPYVIISTCLGKKNFKSIKLTTTLLYKLPGLKKQEGKNIYTLTKNLDCFKNNDLIYECVYWLAKIINGSYGNVNNKSEVVMMNYFKRLHTLFLNILVNITNCDNELLSAYNDVIKAMIQYFPNKINLENNIIYQTELQTLKNLTKLQTNLQNIKSSEENIFLELNDRFNEITIISNQAKVDQNYQNAESSWLIEMANISKHILIKRYIMRNLVTRKLAKTREKLNMNLSSLLAISTPLKPVINKIFIMKNLLKTVCKNHSIFELFMTINDLQSSIINVFYATNIENPIDFHYIINQLAYLTKIMQDYTKYICDIIQNLQLTKPGIFDNFINVKKLLNEFDQSFNAWKSDNMKPVEDFEPKFNKNKKILGSKWEERRIMSKLQIISKKRAGLKRQKALQEKKEILKGKF